MPGPEDDDETPLISSHREDGDGDAEFQGELPPSDAVAHAREPAVGRPRDGGRIGSFVWVLTLSACISGLLFGYDTGVISATLVSIGTSLSGRALTSLDKSVITSVTALAALCASPAASAMADAAGRRPVILCADALFVLGAAVQALSTNVAGMVAGRAVVGAAVGAASFVVPLYVAELAPARHRGALVTLNVLCVTLGQVLAYIIGWALSDPPSAAGVGAANASGWRWMVGLGAVPAVIQGVLLLLFMPETPRWLVRAGRPAAAKNIIRKTIVASSTPEGQRDDDEDEDSTRLVNTILGDIEAEVRAEEEEIRRRTPVAGASTKNGDGEWLRGWRELWTVPRNRRALTIACLLQGLQQLCGFNSLMYFSATIFTILGFSVPTLTSLSVAATNFVFTAAALWLIDRVGRRRILLWSVPFMVLSLLCCSAGFRFFNLEPADGDGDGASPTTATTGNGRRDAAAAAVLASITAYVAGYAVGLGNVPWMQSELFGVGVRALGSGLATCVNWAANFVVGLSFLPLVDALGAPWTFASYAAVCAVGWVAIWLIYPETAGLSLEEAADLLEHGWGVRR